MPVTLSDYQEIVCPGVILELQSLAERVRGRMESRYGSARLVARPGNPELWRVLVGLEPTESQANGLAERIRRESDDKTAPFVVRLDSV